MRDRSGQPWWSAVSKRRSFMISEQHYGPLAWRTVLTAALPLFRADGTFDGALALGIGVDVLGALMRARSMPNGTVAALLDAEGTVVSSSDDAVAQALFERPIDLRSGELLRGEDAEGNGWRFAIAEVRGDDLFIAFAQRETALFAWSYVDLAANVALPLLMALFAFGARSGTRPTASSCAGSPISNGSRGPMGADTSRCARRRARSGPRRESSSWHARW